MTKFRRISARFALPILTVWLCILPAKSYAFLPALLPLGGVFFESSAGAAASIALAQAATGTSAGAIAAGAAGTVVIDAVATGMITTIGAVVGYLALHDLQGNKVRIPLTTDPSVSTIPAPGAPATVAPTGGSVTSEVAFTSNYVCSFALGGSCAGRTGITDALSYWETSCANHMGGNTSYTMSFVPAANGFFACHVVTNSTGLDQVTWAAQPVPSSNCPTNSTLVGLTCSCSSGYSADPTATSCVAVVAQTCAPGYVLDGATCILVSPRQVTSDNSLDYERPGASYLPYDPFDVDASQPLRGVATPAGIEFAAADADGLPVQYRIIPLVNGGSQVEIRTPFTDSVGQTGTDTGIFVIGPTGVIESYSQTQTNDVPTVIPGVTPAETTITYSPPAGSPSTTTQTTSATITFPNDYARQGEAVTAANLLKPLIDAIHTDLSQTTVVADPVDPGVLPDDWGSTFSNLLGWQLPAHSSVCPTGTLDLSNLGMGFHTMDAHCGLLVNHAQSLHNAMIVVFSMLALFVVLRA